MSEKHKFQVKVIMVCMMGFACCIAFSVVSWERLQTPPESTITPQWTPKCQKCATAWPESVKDLQRRIGMPEYAVDGKLGRDTQGYYEAWYGNTLAEKAFVEN